jgi:hypothetical protein
MANAKDVKRDMKWTCLMFKTIRMTIERIGKISAT